MCTEISIGYCSAPTKASTFIWHQGQRPKVRKMIHTDWLSRADGHAQVSARAITAPTRNTQHPGLQAEFPPAIPPSLPTCTCMPSSVRGLPRSVQSGRPVKNSLGGTLLWDCVVLGCALSNTPSLSSHKKSRSFVAAERVAVVVRFAFVLLIPSPGYCRCAYRKINPHIRNGQK